MNHKCRWARTVGEAAAEGVRGRRRHANIDSVQIEPAPKKNQRKRFPRTPAISFFAMAFGYIDNPSCEKGKSARDSNGCILAGCRAERRLAEAYGPPSQDNTRGIDGMKTLGFSFVSRFKSPLFHVFSHQIFGNQF